MKTEKKKALEAIRNLITCYIMDKYVEFGEAHLIRTGAQKLRG